MKFRQKQISRLILLLFLVMLFVIVCLWKSSSMIIAPRKFQGTLTPGVFSMKFEDVSFITDDSIAIQGWYIPCNGSQNAIILLHGFAVDKSDLLDIAKLLYQNGYSVLLFDFRAHGYSGGTHCSLGFHEIHDLNAAVRFLKDLGIARIGAMGFSMGGTVVLLTAAENKHILAVISDSAYLSFGSAVRDFAAAYYHIPEFPFIPPIIWFAGKRLRIDPRTVDLTHHVSSISPRPILIIHADDDKEITVSNAHHIYQYAKEPKDLWLVKNAGHLGAHALYQYEYEQRIITFFNCFLPSLPPEVSTHPPNF